MVDVNLNLMLDQSPASAGPRWERALECLRAKAAGGGHGRPYAVCRWLTFDIDNPASISACIASAREKARQVRELIGSEMWEGLNRLYFQVRRAASPTSGRASRRSSSTASRTASTCSAGSPTRPSARASRTTSSTPAGSSSGPRDRGAARRLLRPDPRLGRPGATPPSSTWNGSACSLCCAAFEAYCKEYTADLRPTRVAEFLLLSEEFPHSVRFAADRVQSALERIGDSSSTRKTSRVSRLAGRLRATLSFGQIDEILGSGLHAYLDDVLGQCGQIHAAIYQHYIAYPIETAMEV